MPFTEKRISDIGDCTKGGKLTIPRSNSEDHIDGGGWLRDRAGWFTLIIHSQIHMWI